jgi:IS5 family transposase
MRREIRKTRTYLGRVVSDIELKIADSATQQRLFVDDLELAKCLLKQKITDSNKLYSPHAPEVECISKSKAHKRYEFGVKVSVATTNKGNFIAGGVY